MNILEQRNSRWRVTDRLALWESEGPMLTDELLDKFGKTAIQVLLESNPELDLPKEQRFAVNIYGRPREYSKHLREGVAETLALLGSHASALKTCTRGKSASVASKVVNDLLAGANSSRWASLNDVLPLLAEASPEAFLDAVGGASEKPDEPFTGVFAEEVGGVTGRNYVTGLLWALEALAWSRDYLVRVGAILANLAAVDPGGNYANRPANSLATILLPWLPRTCADTASRHATMKCVVRNQPDVAWKVLLNLLPKHHATSFPTSKPKWRNYIPEGWEEGVTNGQRWDDEACYSSLALELAGCNPVRLGELVSYYFLLGQEFQKAFRERLESETVSHLPEDQRLGLWTILSNKTSNHRKYADSDVWSVPEELLQELDAVADKLKPMEPEVRHKRLFSGHDMDLYDETGDWEEKEKRLLQKRIEAIRELLDRGGFKNLMTFVRSVESPHEVGGAFGADPVRANDTEVLPMMLEATNDADKQFAASYVWNRFRSNRWEWVDSLDRTTWSSEAKAVFFAVLPFNNETWERMTLDLGDSETSYWKRVRSIPDRENPRRLDYAIDRLIVNDRADAAIRCLWLGKSQGGKFSELSLRALEAIENQHHLDAHAVGELLKQLQGDTEIDEGRLARVEIKFLSLLGRFGAARPLTLYRHLAERPEFFCEVIKALYRSKKEIDQESDLDQESDQEPELDEARATAAQRAYQLLSDWNYPPGQLRDTTFDAQKLKDWCAAVKLECVKSGHWEMASHQIGQVLFNSPKDSEGLWDENVCELLDSKDDIQYRRGLRIRIFNSRGFHGFSGGGDETKLAEKWERVAGLAEAKGFVRLGTELRDLASNYREYAKRSLSDNRYDDSD